MGEGPKYPPSRGRLTGACMGFQVGAGQVISKLGSGHGSGSSTPGAFPRFVQQRHDFRSKPTATTVNGLPLCRLIGWAVAFAAPVRCWWTLAKEPSTMPARRYRSPLVAPNTWPPVIPQTGGAERNGAYTSQTAGRELVKRPQSLLPALNSCGFERSQAFIT